MAGLVFVRILHKKGRPRRAGGAALYIHQTYTSPLVKVCNIAQIFPAVLVDMATGRQGPSINIHFS